MVYRWKDIEIMERPLLSRNGLSVDHFALLLQKCLKYKSLPSGKQVHALLLNSGTDLNYLSLHSKLVGMYASCGDMKSATLVFKRIERPNVFALNWMVLGFAFNGFYEEAIGYFCLMRDSLHLCNNFTFSVVLKACVGLMDLNKGKDVHCVLKKMGFETDVSVANALIDMYGKCGDLSCARKVFDRMPVRDVASWTSMICGYCNTGEIEEPVVLFERMKLEGFEPNEFTWNAMIAGYARRGDSNAAFLLFNRMSGEGLVPDLVTWNAVISGFVQSQKAAEALKVFQDMLLSGIRPNQVTVTGLLPACGLTGAIHRGREIHGLIYRMGLDINAFIASALIDMYSKCGSVEAARNVFDLILVKNIASWNAMIGCYGKHGMFDVAMDLFERMKKEGIQPNEVTLVSLLFTCSHSGEIEKGLRIFKSLKESHAVEVNKEHYACVIDMLCRSGKMVEAYELVKEMPMRVTESIVGAFFNGCKIHGKRDLAKMMAEEILGMDLERPGGFVTLSNIYAADGDWDEVQNVRNAMKKTNVNKNPGLSRVEKRNEFLQPVENESNGGH